LAVKQAKDQALEPLGTMVGGAKQRGANKASKQQAARATAQQQQQEETQARSHVPAEYRHISASILYLIEARGYSIK